MPLVKPSSRSRLLPPGWSFLSPAQQVCPFLSQSTVRQQAWICFGLFASDQYLELSNQRFNSVRAEYSFETKGDRRESSFTLPTFPLRTATALEKIARLASTA